MFISLSTFALLVVLMVIGLNYLKNWRNYLMISGLFLFLAVASFEVVKNYTFPAARTAQGGFYNTAYHLIRHDGFEFSDSLNLVNESSVLHSIWDDKKGNCLARPDSNGKVVLALENFFEPLYRQLETAAFPSLYSRKKYRLANSIFDGDIGQGFEIYRKGERLLAFAVLEQNDSLFYQIHLGQRERPSYCRGLHRTLKKGYPLGELLDLAGLTLQKSDRDLLGSCFLLRETVGDVSSALHFFPSANLYLAEGIKVQTASGRHWLSGQQPVRQKITLNKDDRFYCNIGQQKSPVYYFANTTDNRTQLRYNFPVKYYLKDDKENHLFICSSYGQVTRNAQSGGFYYPLFKEEENANHINGALQYKRGSAREAMAFRIRDLHTGAQPRLVCTGEAFQLHSSSGLAWLFEMENLRDSNQIKVAYLYGFMLFYCLMVLLSIRMIGLPN
ncbi:MAG: hypothetical protein AAF990_22090, partial [Bacteroidota bacterium]